VNPRGGELKVRDLPCRKQTSGNAPRKEEAASGGNKKHPGSSPSKILYNSIFVRKMPA
jgi:hypothetical protein